MANDDIARATGQATPLRQVLLLETDLFFQVKVVDTLKHSGYQTRAVRRLDDFLRWLSGGDANTANTAADADGAASDAAGAPPSGAHPVIALVDTAARGVDWQAAIRAARAMGTPVVAFGSHVDIATQEAAREAGATSVIANSKLASDLPGVLERALAKSERDLPH